MNDAELRSKLTALEAGTTWIRSEGEVLTDVRIDSSKPDGSTVRGNPATQYRLRVKGQKSRYLKTDRVAEVRAAIDWGKQIHKLEREMDAGHSQAGQTSSPCRGCTKSNPGTIQFF